MSRYKLSKRSLKRLTGVNPLLIAIIVGGIENSPHDFGIPKTGGVRLKSIQYQLFLDGKSNADGEKKKSYHQLALAVDIFGYKNGRATWNKQVLSEIAQHLIIFAKEKYNVDLIWGGNWKTFKDLPHFQISKKYL